MQVNGNAKFYAARGQEKRMLPKTAITYARPSASTGKAPLRVLKKKLTTYFGFENQSEPPVGASTGPKELGSFSSSS